MTYKAKISVCSEIPTKHSTQSEHHVEFLNVILGGIRRAQVKVGLRFERRFSQR